MREKIHLLLDQLRLQGIATCLDEVLNDAEKKGTAISDVLVDLLETEYRIQQEHALENRIKRAKLPWPWTIDTFPFQDQPGVMYGLATAVKMFFCFFFNAALMYPA